MVVMEDVMEEEEVVDKVTKMAADWIGIMHRLTDVRSLIFWWMLNLASRSSNHHVLQMQNLPIFKNCFLAIVYHILEVRWVQLFVRQDLVEPAWLWGANEKVEWEWFTLNHESPTNQRQLYKFKWYKNISVTIFSTSVISMLPFISGCCLVSKDCSKVALNKFQSVTNCSLGLCAYKASILVFRNPVKEVVWFSRRNSK